MHPGLRYTEVLARLFDKDAALDAGDMFDDIADWLDAGLARYFTASAEAHEFVYSVDMACARKL